MNTLYNAEASVLGALIAQPDLIDELYIKPHEFHEDDRHGLILQTLQHCHEVNGTVDVLLITQAAGSNIGKIGGPGYLLQLYNAVPDAHNINHYQRIVREAYISRETATSMRTLYELSQTQGINVREQIAAAKARLEELEEMAADNQDDGLHHMGSSLEGHAGVVMERKTSRGITGARTLSAEIDKQTGGHQRYEYEIIAARPSMGKTAAMVCDAIRTADNSGGIGPADPTGYAAAIFSGEMPELQIKERFICALGNLESKKMREGEFTDDDWRAYDYARDKLDRLPIYITDKPGMTVEFIRREVKRLKRKHSEIVVYVDYIQLIESSAKKFKDDRERVTYVSKHLKGIAREFGVTVVALSQLSRKVEERQDKRPMMSDLGESGGLERDADIINFLYRDDYYNRDSEKKNIVEVIRAKGRNVGVGVTEMAFLKQYGRFLDLDRGHHGGKAT